MMFLLQWELGYLCMLGYGMSPVWLRSQVVGQTETIKGSQDQEQPRSRAAKYKGSHNQGQPDLRADTIRMYAKKKKIKGTTPSLFPHAVSSKRVIA